MFINRVSIDAASKVSIKRSIVIDIIKYLQILRWLQIAKYCYDRILQHCDNSIYGNNLEISK